MTSSSQPSSPQEIAAKFLGYCDEDRKQQHYCPNCDCTFNPEPLIAAIAAAIEQARQDALTQAEEWLRYRGGRNKRVGTFWSAADEIQKMKEEPHG